MALGQNIHNILPSNSILVYQKPVAGKRPIAPAPMMVSGMPPSGLKCKTSKKFAGYCGLPYAPTPQQTVSVQRRNARERNRVKQVNNGFANLRQHIPAPVVAALSSGGRGASKKLSKVDTLRVAVEYIRSLQKMLDENSENSHSQKSLSQMSSSSSYYGSMSEPSTAASPTPSQLSDNSVYTTPHFKHEPYDIYVDPSTSPAPSYVSEPPQIHHHQTMIPGMTTLTPNNNNYLQHHQNIDLHHPAIYKSEIYQDGYDSAEMSPQNPEDEELLDAITSWQEEQQQQHHHHQQQQTFLY